MMMMESLLRVSLLERTGCVNFPSNSIGNCHFLPLCANCLEIVKFLGTFLNVLVTPEGGCGFPGVKRHENQNYNPYPKPEDQAVLGLTIR